MKTTQLLATLIGAATSPLTAIPAEETKNRALKPWE
jgi:hypothetical protein